MSASPVLVLENVSREFGGLKAVDGVNLVVRPGERRAVIGPNGAGKTTLFNVISGEFPPSSGRVLLFGDDVSKEGPHQRAARGLARTFQIIRLFANLDVLENALLACVALDPRKYAMHRPLGSCRELVETANRLIERFGLTRFRKELVRHLSYGDQRKLEVELSVAGRPKLLLLDEPMAGLSAAEGEAMRVLIDGLDPSIAVLLIEHDMDIAFGFAENVTVLYQGRVLTDGHKDEIRANRNVQEVYLGFGEES